ncbi:MAG: hypothetical protein KF842_03785 [Caulobacter sp.]|nr:hypothetical protein [Caulobacter sp.]
MTPGRWRLEVGTNVVRADDRPDSAVMDRFFEGYDRAFILPDEREEIDGFRACLALNGRTFPWAPDPSREVVMTLETGTGDLLGGANFLATRLADDRASVAVALNYIYIERPFRGRGLSRDLLASVSRLAGGLWDDGEGPVLLFIEQNDPVAKSDSDSLADSAHSGIDQIDRLEIWANLGASALDLAYVQPALSPDKAPDSSLIYAVVGAGGSGVDAGLLRRHLVNFFGISVLKGRDPGGDLVAAPQLQALAGKVDRHDEVALIDFPPLLAALRNGEAPQASSFVDLAHRLAGAKP